MWLLHTHTLQLENFFGTVPRYAILSHTWEAEEVTMEDMKPGGRATDMKGYRKLSGSARLARYEGYEYIWIDTCCIDKSSSAELSEAINSMFQWYKESAVCYAYLADVADVTDISSSESRFVNSKWFKRGWTLQEMIAPKEVVFLGKSWNHLGTRSSLANAIRDVTKIPLDVLMGKPLDGISAAARMSWASKRITTKPEDMAYCLLGLFNVNMPLLYGEGQEKAFTRLQEEFLKASDDETLFAWRADPKEAAEKPYWGLLAASPRYFEFSSELKKPRFKSHIDNHPTEITNRGLRVELSLDPMDGDESQSIFLATLHCTDYRESWGDFFAIILQRLSSFEKQYARIAPDIFVSVALGTFNIPTNSLSPIFIERYQRLRHTYLGGTISLSASHTDPEGQLIFVRSTPRASESAAGIYFFPEVQLRVPVEGSISVAVSGLQEPWLGYTEVKTGRPYYSIDFQYEEIMNVQPHELEVRNLRQRKALGCLKLCLTFTQNDGERTWETSTYLVVGLEAIPPNPFGTPPGYTRPWYSFANGIDENTVLQRFNNSDSCKTNHSFELEDWLLLEAEFGVGGRFSRVFHKLDLVIVKSRI